MSHHGDHAFSILASEEIAVQISPHTEIRIAAIETPATQLRENARLLCRKALRRMLASRLDCQPETIDLIREPGKPPRIASHPAIGISISHESGLSLIAANLTGPVGIDLLQVGSAPAQAPELLALSHEYLGPETTARLAAMPSHDGKLAFSQAWTYHEARLKCLGIGLAEWNSVLEARLSICTVHPLHLPLGYVGSVATQRQN